MIQRVPKGSSARHTSSATVVVRQNVDYAPVEVRDADIRIDRYRGHGAGGQHRNKVSTAIRLVHEPTGIVITRESGRSQSANLESATKQLREELAARGRSSREAKVNEQRSVLFDDSSRKDFTHNEKRSEVVVHTSGKRYRMSDWQAGKWAR